MQQAECGEIFVTATGRSANMDRPRRRSRRSRRPHDIIWPPQRTHLLVLPLSEIEARVQTQSCPSPESSPGAFQESVDRLVFHLDLDIESSSFSELNILVRQGLSRRYDSVMQMVVSRTLQLEVTLCFLVKGYAYAFLTNIYTISVPLLKKIIPGTCSFISDLNRRYSHCPNTVEGWKRIAARFKRKFRFPNCIGALAGLRMTFNDPAMSDDFHPEANTEFILLVVADVTRQFIMHEVVLDVDNFLFQSTSIAHDVGVYARVLDSRPPAKPKNRSTELPYVLVGSDSFPLQTRLMTPYSHTDLSDEERRYNERLSGAMEASRESMAMLCKNFGVLRTTLNMNFHEAMDVVGTCITLHNFLVSKKDNLYNVRSTHEPPIPSVEVKAYDGDDADAVSVRNLFMGYINRDQSESHASPSRPIA